MTKIINYLFLLRETLCPTHTVISLRTGSPYLAVQYQVRMRQPQLGNWYKGTRYCAKCYDRPIQYSTVQYREYSFYADPKNLLYPFVAAGTRYWYQVVYQFQSCCDGRDTYCKINTKYCKVSCRLQYSNCHKKLHIRDHQLLNNGFTSIQHGSTLRSKLDNKPFTSELCG